MQTQSVIIAAIVAFSGFVLVTANSYGPTYNDGYEHQQQQSYNQPQQSYQPPQQSYGYQQAAPAYHAAPAYPKYQAPSSAHHTQYDNYYPKQSYSKPMYAPAKPYSPPPQMYQPAPAYSAPKPAYPSSASYGSSSGHDMEEYKARA